MGQGCLADNSFQKRFDEVGVAGEWVILAGECLTERGGEKLIIDKVGA